MSDHPESNGNASPQTRIKEVADALELSSPLGGASACVSRLYRLHEQMKAMIAAEPFDSPDARRLIAALDAHLSSRYSPEQRFGPNLKPEQLAQGLGTFVVARIDGRAVGCGAIRLLDETTVEVKRMYVEPELRGHGVAKEILAHLEGAGQELGARRSVLETGIYQDEAVGLYRRAGYTQVDCWGEYAAAPTSVCFEKTI